MVNPLHSVAGNGDFLLVSIAHISGLRPTTETHESTPTITHTIGHEFTVSGMGYQVVAKFETEDEANAERRDLYSAWKKYCEMAEQ